MFNSSDRLSTTVTAKKVTLIPSTIVLLQGPPAGNTEQPQGAVEGRRGSGHLPASARLSAGSLPHPLSVSHMKAAAGEWGLKLERAKLRPLDLISAHLDAQWRAARQDTFTSRVGVEDVGLNSGQTGAENWNYKNHDENILIWRYCLTLMTNSLWLLNQNKRKAWQITCPSFWNLQIVLVYFYVLWVSKCNIILHIVQNCTYLNTYFI